MPNSLVTGGAGFIGSHVARHLLDAGHKVTVLDDLSGGFTDNVPEGARFVKDTITEQYRIERLFDESHFDYVFHLAAYAAEGLSHFIRRFNYNNNLIGSVNLINESVKHNVGHFVFTSSLAVYGTNQTPMTEDMVPNPEDPYGVAKYAVELDLRCAHETFGLDYTIFRPHNVYGEGQNIGDKYRNVIGIFMNQIMQGKPMTIFGDGLQTRAFSYIDDVAPIIVSSISRPSADTVGQVFNVGADHDYTVLELAHVVAHGMGVEPVIEHMPERFEVKHAFTSHDKVRSVFGDTFTVPLEVGVNRMATWAKAHGPQQTTQFTGVEVRKNFPLGWEASVRA